MKAKFVVISIAALLCIAMTACGAKNEPAAVTPTETTAATEAETESETETAPAVDTRVRDIAGTWNEDSEKAADPRTLTVNVDGSYILDYPGGGYINGTVIVENESHPDGTETVWYSFYESDGRLWTGFQRSDEQPQTDLYSGQDGEQHFLRASGSAAAETTAAGTTSQNTGTTARNTTTAATKPASQDGANANGFIPETEVPHNGVSVKQFDGVWMNPNNTIESISFFDCDYLRGRFQMENADNSVTDGYIQLEYKKNADGSKASYYNLYSDAGKLLFSVGTSLDIPFEHFSSTDGKHYFERPQNDAEPTAEAFIGLWECGRCQIEFSEGQHRIYATVTRQNNTPQYDTWAYECKVENGSLLSTNADGTHIIVSVDTDDGSESRSFASTTMQAEFYIDDSGVLHWNDMNDHTGDGMNFIKQ